jgi:hypothetical protein
MNNLIKALSLECLGPQTVLDTPRNSEIFGEIEKLDVDFKDASAAQKVEILARIFDLCIIMDVI